MSVYNFLTWKKNRDVILYAYPKGFNRIYAIYPLKDTKHFELVLIDNSSSNDNKSTSVYSSLTKAIFAAQTHFNDMVNDNGANPS